MYFVSLRSHFSLLHMINLRTNNFPTVQYNNRAKVTVNEIDDYDSNEGFSFQTDQNHTVQRGIPVNFNNINKQMIIRLEIFQSHLPVKYRQRSDVQCKIMRFSESLRKESGK